MSKINPRNLTAQLNHRAVGNPASTLPDSAISNSFPGLEFDFRNLWRRIFEGIVMIENSNYVLSAEEPKFAHLVKHRMLRVDGHDLVTTVSGPQLPGSDSAPLTTGDNPGAIAFMEWSNALARVLSRQGEVVKCEFTLEESPNEAPIPKDGNMLVENLRIRRVFEEASVGGVAEPTALIAAPLLEPGELTQGLCSPWQNDYRECACYYWAASRPDYVNVVPGSDGLSHGDNWLQKQRTGEYVPDNRQDSRLHSYDDLFKAWQRLLRFQIHGRDADTSVPVRREDDGRK